jgi:hypothetical protein
MYNLVHGRNQQAPLVLALLGLAPGDVGRFRDAWFEKTADGGLRCAVHTRNGGGNREDQSDAWETIQAHPMYQDDADDDFDCTYATAYFGIPPETPPALVEQLPDELKERSALVARLSEIELAPVNMGDRWQQAIDAIGKPAAKSSGTSE